MRRRVDGVLESWSGVSGCGAAAAGLMECWIVGLVTSAEVGGGRLMVDGPGTVEGGGSSVAGALGAGGESEV